MVCLLAIIVLFGLSQGSRSEDLGAEKLGAENDLLQRELNALNVHLDTIALQLKEKLHELKESRSLRRKRDEIPNPADLRHGFVPQTSVGNRESVDIIGFQYMPSRKARFTLAFLEYFEYKNRDFLVTYNMDTGFFHVFAFDINQDPFQGDVLTSLASVEVATEHVKVFGLPRRSQPIERYEVMFIALYTSTELQFHCFHEYESSGTYAMQLNQTISLKDVTDTASFILDTDLYFIMARSSNDTYDGWVKSILYKWNVKRSQFELHQTIRTHNPQSVVPLEMEGKHYLVFAEKLNMTSVWKYDRRQLQFKRHHELFPAGCVSVEEFTLGFNNYIILTNEHRNQSHLLKWSGFRFDIFQVIDIDDINSWRAIDSPNCQDGVLLTLSYGAPYNTFVLYEYNYLTDEFEPLNHTGHFVNGTSFAFRASDNRLFASVSGPDFKNYVKLFEIYYTTRHVADPIVIEGRQLRRRHFDIVDSLKRLSSTVDDAEKLLEDSVTLAGDHIIYGTKTFTKLIVNGSMAVDTIKVNHSYLYGDGPEGKDSLGYLAINLTQHNSDIDLINATLNDSVSLDFYQDVTGLKTFWNVSFLHSLSTTDLNSDVINDVWLEVVANSSLWVNRPDQVVDGTLNFTESLQVNGNVDLMEDSYINSIDLSEDAVVTNKSQVIDGKKRFVQDVTVTENVNFDPNIKLNGLDISEEVVTLDGDHTLNAPVNFTDGVHIMGDIITSQSIDSISVSSLANNILTIVKNQTLEGPLVFMNTPSFADDIDLSGKVNGVDLSDLSESAVRVNQNETILGEKTFGTDLFVNGKCEANGLIDGVNLTQIITSRGFQTVTAVKNFTEGLTADVIEVGQLVDNIDLSLEAVGLSGNHDISGVKTFSDGAHFEGDVDTTGLVDGVNVSSLATSVLTKSGNQTVEGSVTFNENVTFEADLEAEGLVNDVNITFLHEDAVYEADESDHHITGKKEFMGNVTMGSGSMDIMSTYNGYNISTDFLNKITEQIVTGNKTFQDGFDIYSNVTLGGSIDGWSTEDLQFLPVNLHDNANITGEKTLMANATFWQDADLLGRINGLDISEEAMFVNRAQNVTGEKKFASIYASDEVTAEFMTIENDLNGQNWQDFVDSRVTLSGEQTISGNFNFSETIHVLGDVYVDGLVSGYNVTFLEQNTLRKSTEQLITGEKNISGSLDITDDATFDGLVDGVNISAWKDQAFRLNGDQVIIGSKIFEDHLEVSGDLDVSELINGVNVTFMEHDAVMKDNIEPQIIPADKIFEDGLDLRSNLTVNGLVNGINISDLLLNYADQEITGHFTFTKNFSVTTEMVVLGYINGVNITKIDSLALKLNEEGEVDAHKTFLDEMIVESDVTVPDRELVDGVDVSELALSAIRLDEEFEFDGKIRTTDTITFLGDLDLVGTCEGEDLSAWAKKVVRINVEQDVNDTKIFSGLFSTENVVTVTESLEFDTAFGINVSDWSQDIVYRDQNCTITGEKVFQDEVDIEGSIIVAGTVDGIDLSEDVVTLTDEQTIVGKKKFTQAVHSKENVEVTELVSSFFLPAMLEDTFDIHKRMNVTGSKTFLEELLIKGNIYLSDRLNESLFEVPVNLFDNYFVSGYWIFEAETTFTEDLYISGLASLRNLTKISESRVTLSDDGQVVSGPLDFDGMVIFESDVDLLGRIKGITLLDIKRGWLDFLEEISGNITRLRWLSSELCDIIDDLQLIYEDSVADFDYFTTVQDIPEQTQHMIAFTYQGTTHLAVAVYAQDHVYTCVDSYIYSWDHLMGQFYVTDSVLTNGAMKFAAFQIGQWQFLAVANAGVIPCADESSVYSSVFIFNTSLVFFQAFEVTAVDVEAYHVENRTYLIFAGEENVLKVYVHSLESRQFIPLQTIWTENGALAVEYLHVGDRNLLIVAESASEIAKIFVIGEGGNLTLHQTVSSRYAYDITGCSFSGKIAVIFAGYSTNYGSGVTVDTDSLVYFWSEDSDMLVMADFMIPFRRASDSSFLTLGFHSYVILVEPYVKVELFRYEGSGHFVSAFTLPVPGVKSVEGFTIGSEVYLAIAIDPLMDTNPSKIIKASLQGHVYEIVENLCDFNFGRMAYHTEDDLCD